MVVVCIRCRCFVLWHCDGIVGRKGSPPPPPRPRFARLRLCKWEQGKHAAEGCWEHNQNRSCPAVHKDQPDLLADLRRSRSPATKALAFAAESIEGL